MEERRGPWLERVSRLMARGREETTPVAAHLALITVIGAFVGLLILAAILVWVLLR